tara:strand:+ start:1224 stop:2132 length:909 start_codon:yes stop_codon:yes gene_type:complete
MAASINASTSAGVVTTADTSGNLNLQSNGTTIIGYTSTGVTVTGTASATQVISTAQSFAATGQVQVHGADKITLAQESTSTSVITAYGTAAGTPGNLYLNTRGSTGTSGGGVVCVGLAKGYSGSQAFDVNSATADFTVTVANSNAAPYGFFLKYAAATPNGTSNSFLDLRDNSAVRAQLYSNGGLANFSGNNVNLSDRREKTNFAPAKSYLPIICAIPIQTFNFIDQNLADDPGLTLGIVAQDVQAVAPELVTESDWGTMEEPKPRLSIYQTDLQYALMKCIQEQQTLIESLTARIAALESK